MPSYPQTKRDLIIAIMITIAIAALEVWGSRISNSLALLSDALHVLSDVIGLVAALVALTLARVAADGRRTFGFHRVEVLAALLNGILLSGIAVALAFRGYEKIMHPSAVDVPIVIWVGLIGLGANVYVAFLLRRNENLNIQAAFLHVVGDALASVAVVLGALVMLITGNFLFDGLVSLLIAVVILVSAYWLLRNALSILLESAPRSAHPDKIAQALMAMPSVREVHDLHVWSVCSDIVHLNAHVVVADKKLSQLDALQHQMEQILANQFKIAHSTLQFESMRCECAKTGACEIYGNRASPFRSRKVKSR